MANVSKSAGRPYLILALILCGAAAAYWLYDACFRHSSLPVVMESPSFALTDLDGNTVTEERFDGKIRLMSFIFTRCPDICPATTANMVLLQEELREQGLFGEEIEFVSVSFDPDNDTPEVLQQYAERMGIDPGGWMILRGEEGEAAKLASEYKLSVVKLDDGLFAHSVTSLLLIDGRHRVRNIYRMGEYMDNKIILAEMNALLKERRRNS